MAYSFEHDEFNINTSEDDKTCCCPNDNDANYSIRIRQPTDKNHYIVKVDFSRIGLVRRLLLRLFTGIRLVKIKYSDMSKIEVSLE